MRKSTDVGACDAFLASSGERTGASADYGQLEDEIAVRRGGVPGLAVSGVSMQRCAPLNSAAVTAANLRNHETGNGSAMAVEGGSDAASASSSAATSGSLKRKRQETGSGRYR